MKFILLSIAIGVVVGVFGGVLLFRSPADNPPLSVSPPSVPLVAPVDQGAKRGESVVRLEPSMDIDAYYQTIIDKNIFRPLNWEPPQRVSRYTLLGTAIATDRSSAEAYIQERESNQFYTVSVESKLKIQEIPITYHPRAGDSNLNAIRDAARHIRFMLKHKVTPLRE